MKTQKLFVEGFYVRNIQGHHLNAKMDGFIKHNPGRNPFVHTATELLRCIKGLDDEVLLIPASFNIKKHRPFTTGHPLDKAQFLKRHGQAAAYAPA
jgi:hypothetical protein